MFGHAVSLLVYWTPWLALAIGAAVRALAPARVREGAWAVAIAATAVLLVVALAWGEDARARFESAIAAPILGAWQLTGYLPGVLLGRLVAR